MLVTTILGMVFCVLYWKLGIECAVLAHFTFDAMVTGLLVPAYVSNNPIVQVVVLVGLLFLGVIAWFILNRTWRKDVYTDHIGQPIMVGSPLLIPLGVQRFEMPLHNQLLRIRQ